MLFSESKFTDHPTFLQSAHLAIKNLKPFFEPASIAVIGASANPQKIGHQILKNIKEAGFAGKVYPVHPSLSDILNLKSYPSVTAIPDTIDLAVVVIPASEVINVVEECGQKKVKAVIVISSGFGEVGNHEDEQRLKEIVDRYGMALLGPNVFGAVYTPGHLNASFGPRDILGGNIAFITQSGALGIALMGWTVMEKIGLAALVNIGNKVDIEEKELIEYFNEDQNVHTVLIYMEGLKDGRKFMTTKIKKPVIVLKVGRSQRGARAAASHTGSLAGSDQIFEAAFQQLGVLRASSFNEAFAWARSFALPAPTQRNVLIITNGGGIGVRTTDECEAAGVELLDDSAWLETKFRPLMPSFGSTKNPVDLTGGAAHEQYQKAAALAFTEERIGAVIFLYCETIISNPLQVAQVVLNEYKKSNRAKPALVYMVGGEKSAAAINFLNENGIPAFHSVGETVSSLKALYRWKEITHRPQDTLPSNEIPVDVIPLIESAQKEGRRFLMEHESRKVLELCGIPMPKWAFATNKNEAVAMAQNMYPLAMKITSPDIIHKTEVGGVQLNIKNQEELIAKYDEMINRITQAQPQARILGVNLVTMVSGIECIVGLNQDPQFGPVVMFGLGGVFVEVLKDVTFRVVPFGKLEAERMLSEIKTKKVLDGFRGMKAHKASLVQTLFAVQKLGGLVKEIDINPLITNDQGSFAADARIII